MSVDEDTAAQGDQRTPVGNRQLLIVALVMVLIGSFITFSFEYANHSPKPHGVKLQVVAPPLVVTHLSAALSKADPGGFSMSAAPSAAAARRAILHQQSRGALVIPPHGHATILSAGAAGPALQQIVEKVLLAAAVQAHRHAVLQDVDPLPANDRSGLSAFIFSLGLLVPSVLGSVGLYLFGLRARIWWRIAAAALYAVLGALCGVLLLDAGFGVLTAAPVAVFAIGTFGALSYVLFVAACQATIGLAGTGIAALIMIFVGNAISGGTTPAVLLPNVYRQISGCLPNGAVVRAVRAVSYFHGHGIGRPLLTLSIWVGGSLLIIGANDLLHLSEVRHRPTDTADAIYATSGLEHASNKLKRSRATAGGT